MLESRVLLISSTFALGFLHGLGADHLMAIAALSLGTAGETATVQRSRALGVALRFAIGHALLLAIGAGALIGLAAGSVGIGVAVGAIVGVPASIGAVVARYRKRV
jgi:high-affinity nickel permease